MNRNRSCSGLVLVLGSLAHVGPVMAAETAPVQNFTLPDANGRQHSLRDFASAKAVVIVFLGTECPLAARYAATLTRLAEQFASRGVAFLGVDSNQQDSLADLARFAHDHQLPFPLVKDPGNAVADSLDATRTPEAFLLDANRVVQYRGRIDDQHVVGRSREAAELELLADAIRQLLCGEDVAVARTEPVGCIIGRAKQPAAASSVTYAEHVAPLLDRHCVECHRAGEIAPFALDSYQEAAGWADTMLEAVNDRRMPPWHANPEFGQFANDRRLSEAETRTLADWVRAGAPQGNENLRARPPEFAEGWRLPRVDREILMSDKPFNVPSEGAVKYQYFHVDPGFTEDMWVQGAECRPGNRAVVHHIIVGIRPPNPKQTRAGAVPSVWLTATAPGAAPLLLPDGMAKFVPAGSKLVFQVHYTPNGTPQQDKSSVALLFTTADRVRREVGTIGVENKLLHIPPRTAEHKINAWYGVSRDMVLLSLFPHMHLRGKAFRYEARYPDGSSEILLDVPRYDFAWQQSYFLAEPKRLPRGTQIHCTAAYDNSKENIANPNPDRIVIWGDQTWDEMLIGYMDVTWDQ